MCIIYIYTYIIIIINESARPLHVCDMLRYAAFVEPVQSTKQIKYSDTERAVRHYPTRESRLHIHKLHDTKR